MDQLVIPRLPVVPPLTPDSTPLAAVKAGFAREGRLPVQLVFRRGRETVPLDVRLLEPGNAYAHWNLPYLRDLIHSGVAIYGASEVLIGTKSPYGAELERFARYLYPPNDPKAKVAFSAGFMTKVYEEPFGINWTQRMDAVHYEIPVIVKSDTRGLTLVVDIGSGNIRVDWFRDGVQLGETVNLPWEAAERTSVAFILARCREAIALAREKAGLADDTVADKMRVSSAGIIRSDLKRMIVASITNRLPEDEYEAGSRFVPTLAKEQGIRDLAFYNDGFVGACASEYENSLVLVLGSDLAGGHRYGLAEHAFAPVEMMELCRPGQMFRYPWVERYCTGGEYFSRRGAVVNLAPLTGLIVPGITINERFEAFDEMYEGGDERARLVMETMAVQAANAIEWYNYFRPVEHVVFMGRVVGGEKYGPDFTRAVQAAYNRNWGGKTTVHLDTAPELRQLKKLVGM